MVQGLLSKILCIPPRRINFFFALFFSALLWFLSLPPYGISVLAILSFCPPLIFIRETSSGKILVFAPFILSLLEFGSFWWIAPVISKYGDIPFLIALFLVLLLSFYLGLYLLFFYLTTYLFVEKYGVKGLAFAPFIYVVFEFLKGKIFGGFPWWGLGYSLSMNDYILQSARFFGIYGLSFLGMMVAVSFCLLILSRKELFSLVFSSLTLIFLALAFIDGFFYCKKDFRNQPSLLVGVIQPNIPQDRKWDPQFRGEIIKRMEELSFPLYKECLDMIIIPESSTPLEWGCDRDYDNVLINIAKNGNINLLFGTVLEDEEGIYNGAIILNRRGEKIGEYKKNHLVPFGEYVPFQRYFSFLSPIVKSSGSFQSGKSLNPIEIEGNKIGISICYEMIFPNLIRRQVEKGAEVLVNLSNDAWYVGTPALIQHFLIDRVRCVENSRYLLRSANGGVSGVINPFGKIEVMTQIDKSSSIFGEAKLISEKTFYQKWGDFFIFGFFLILVLGFFFKS